MKNIHSFLFAFFLFSIVAQGQNLPEPGCEIINLEDLNYRHEVHPKLLDNEQQREAGWSTATAYGGCPDTCGNSGFDCCLEMPCEKYQIPVVFTLLVDVNCGGQLLNVGQLNAFINRANAFYDCLGVPFELFKCTNWASANDNLLPDGSTRLYCNNDLSVFYTSSCADSPDPCCCEGDPNCMSNCNLQPDPFGDGISDFSEAIDLNIPNVMNIYIPINYNGFTPFGFSEGGVAFLPSGDFSYGTAFGVNGIQNISQDCTGTAGTTVSIHEFGHFFGLLHTHGAVNNAQVNANDPNGNNWVECPDGSECCTLGDYICDTPPDPNTRTSNVENSNGDPISNCVNNSGCDYDLSNCFSTCGVPYPSNYTNNNIMSYGTCDNFLTQCQIAKMVDALFCARNNLSCCDPDLVDSSTAAPYVTENTFYLCPGDPVPTFIIDNPAGDANNIGLNENCIGWYASDNNTLDFNDLGNGLTFTPPTTGNSAIDTNIPGTYTYFFDDDLNNYSLITCQNDIRKQVTIIVTDDAGSANPLITISDCEQDQLINLSNQTQLSDNNIIGWYFSADNPTNTLTNPSDINIAINGATTGNPANPNFGEIFQPNNAATNIDGFSINCDALAANGGNGTYYVSPFVAYNEGDVICSTSISGDPIDWNGGEGASAGPFFPVMDCDAQGRTDYTFEIVIEIGGCDVAFEDFIFEIKPGAACLSQQPSGGTIINCNAGTFVFTEAMILNELPNYDPFSNAICLNAINASGNFTGIDYLATLNIIYAGQDAQDFWTTQGAPNIATDSNIATNCFWGLPQVVSCNCSDDCFEIIDYNVEAGDCDLTGVEIQLIDEAGAVLDTQAINAGGSSGSFGTYFCGVYYVQLANTPPCFTEAGASTGPTLVNLDGQGISFVTFAPFPLIPTLSQWGLLLMALLLMIFGALAIFQKQIKTSLSKE